MLTLAGPSLCAGRKSSPPKPATIAVPSAIEAETFYGSSGD